MWGHYGSMVMEVYLGPFNEASNLTIDFLSWYRPFFMEDYAPFAFLRNRVLMALYLCSRFCIFDKHILKEYVS